MWSVFSAVGVDFLNIIYMKFSLGHPTRSRFFLVFFGPRASAELVHNSKLRCLLHAQPSQFLCQLIPNMRSKAPAQLLPFPYNKLLFPKLYRLWNVPVQESRASTAWELSKLRLFCTVSLRASLLSLICLLRLERITFRDQFSYPPCNLPW
jgi:hypothetical protein